MPRLFPVIRVGLLKTIGRRLSERWPPFGAVFFVVLGGYAALPRGERPGEARLATFRQRSGQAVGLRRNVDWRAGGAASPFMVFMRYRRAKARHLMAPQAVMPLFSKAFFAVSGDFGVSR